MGAHCREHSAYHVQFAQKCVFGLSEALDVAVGWGTSQGGNSPIQFVARFAQLLARTLLFEIHMVSEANPRSASSVVGGRQSTPVSASAPELSNPRRGNVVLRFLKTLGRECLKDSIDDLGAMMAYYAILALFPMMVFVVTLALLVIDDQTILEGVRLATAGMPYAFKSVITETVKSFMASASSGFAIGGALFALWGASRGSAALMGALNSMFNKQETRSFLRRQAIAIGVTFAIAVLLVLAMTLLVAGPTIGHFVADRFGLGHAFDAAWSVGRWLGAWVLVMAVWAITYKWLPNTQAPLRIFTPGAAIGVTLWLGLSALFGLYLDNFASYDKTYGTLGAGIAFLTWIWLSSVAMLFGAEFNDVLADFRKHRSVAAAQLADTEEEGSDRS